MGAALAGVFTGAEPYDIAIAGIDHDAAEREGGAAVEDRGERDATVLGFPQASEGTRDVPDTGVAGIDFDILDTARRQGGADAAELQSLEAVGAEYGGFLGDRKCHPGHHSSHGQRQDSSRHAQMTPKKAVILS